jgi:hypothetical protein
LLWHQPQLAQTTSLLQTCVAVVGAQKPQQDKLQPGIIQQYLRKQQGYLSTPALFAGVFVSQ